jgi:uncharacterized protein
MGYNIKILNCNGLCGSCYETKIRDRVGFKKYDIDKILKRLREESNKVSKDDRNDRKKRATPCFHGGEPMLVPIEDFNKILETTYELWGRTTIQTNGLLLTEKHIDIFKQFQTHIGFSLDGDTSKLNFGRWNSRFVPVNEIEEGTKLVLQNMKKCSDAGLSISVISVLRQYNASKESLPEFIKFLLRLKNEFNCTSVRTNEGVVYDKKKFPYEELDSGSLGYSFSVLSDTCFSDPALDWQPYRDVVDLMLGHMQQTCVFTECDIWKTSSETTIDEEGNLGNCLKGGGAIDGIQVLAADSYASERYLALAQTPQAFGGCKDCKFWMICKGGCPGEAIDDDWRNKTRFCLAWKTLFSHIENKIIGLFPNMLTLSGNKLFPSPAVAVANLMPGGSSWRSDRRLTENQLKTIKDGKSLNSTLSPYKDCPHGDHTDRVKAGV